MLEKATHLRVQMHVHARFFKQRVKFSLRDVPDECCVGAKRLLAPAMGAIIPSHCTRSLFFISRQ